MAELDKWVGEANDLTAPKPLQMAKALRQRKVALANSPKAALAGQGNIFQRRRQGIDEIVNEASR